jgi:hypothetical protein
MDGMEQLSLTDNGLDDELVLSYMQAQLRHHEVVQVLLANSPPDGAEGQILFRLCWNELFHVNAIHRLGLEAQVHADSCLLPT